MKMPDFIIIGAQKSGTTTLFSLLKKHENIYIPPQKEVQFFSDDSLYERGIDWYYQENFSGLKLDELAGDISPQYMLYKKVPHRIKKHIPDVKLIAILRHPIKRAFSQYQMSVRRGIEGRPFIDAFRESAKKSFVDDVTGSTAYYQYSNYSEILSEYISLFGSENILILFQEDLDRDPVGTLKKIHGFLGVRDVIPTEVGVRLHQAGEVRSKWFDSLLKREIWAKKILKKFMSWKVRSALRFWLEQFNIKKIEPKVIDREVLVEFEDFFLDQKAFVEKEFCLVTPWTLSD